MARYIDADALLDRLKFKRDNTDNLDGRKRYGLDSAISQVRKAPTADVVEVVRCKDCVYWESVCGGTTGKCESPRNGLFYEYTDNFDFCSYGERGE